MRPMRRVVAMLLMLLVPLQLAWSAALSVHGHMGERVAALGLHTHDAGHAHPGDSDRPAHDETHEGNHDGGESSGGHHYHPVFVSLVITHEINLNDSFRNAQPPRWAASFTSRTPPLFDWPPSDRR